MDTDHVTYYRFTSKSRLDKAINSLLGIVEGISVDSKINDDEVTFLSGWLFEYREFNSYHPFNELIPVVSEALKDGVLTEDERLDVKWLCEKLRSTDYYDITTADIQRLHAIIGAIAADGVITEAELKGLSDWLMEHENLRKCWPYDEVDSLVTNFLSDKRIEEREHQQLQSFFSQYVALGENRVIGRPPECEILTIQGICAVCPEIVFEGSLFCFTGASKKYTRSQFTEIVIDLGGKVTNSVTPILNYLIIGGEGNPCWSYACYGRKVEKAVDLRKQGHRILLIHEYDFHDAVADTKSG